MRSLERLSASIFKNIFREQLKLYHRKGPEAVLKKSLELLDTTILDDLKRYVKSRMHLSGGFIDRAGNPDLYYTLFGTFVYEALGLNELLSRTRHYLENEIKTNIPDQIHLYCAAIIASKIGIDRKAQQALFKRVRKSVGNNSVKQPVYGAFVTLLACFYSNDFKGLLKVRKKLKKLASAGPLPSSVIAALTVLQHAFGRPTNHLENELESFHEADGGFRAVKAAPVPDLLSSAVVLFAYQFINHDLTFIKPQCLDFIDSRYSEGGFGSNLLDPEPDIEYTFYGMLALGSLA